MRHHSEEHKRKISVARKGQHLSEEHKRKIAKANTGKSFSREHREKIRESRLKEKHWNWQGGISFLPYSLEFTERLKRFIKDRDNNECQNPYCDHKTRELHIHHINYDKQNCSQFNLITLCESCNTKANYNRNKWKHFYKKIVWSKYE